MKTLITLISIIFFSCISVAIAPEAALNFYRKDNPTQDILPLIATEQNGPLTSYFKNKKLAVTGFLKNGERDRQWIFYDEETGNISAIENYKNGLLQGKQYYYHKNGTVRTKGEYTNDKRTGFWQTYNENGDLTMQTIFLDGEDLVSVAMYEPNGKISSSGFIKNGEREGEWKYFDEDGDLLYDVIYEKGIRNGEWKAYTKDGKILITGYYNDGKILGLE